MKNIFLILLLTVTTLVFSQSKTYYLDSTTTSVSYNIETLKDLKLLNINHHLLVTNLKDSVIFFMDDKGNLTCYDVCEIDSEDDIITTETTDNTFIIISSKYIYMVRKEGELYFTTYFTYFTEETALKDENIEINEK